MKHFESQLHQHIRYLAKQRAAFPIRPISPAALSLYKRQTAGELKLNHWLQITAREMGIDYNDISKEGRACAAYYEKNLSNGAWDQPVRLLYTPVLFEAQLRVLVEAADRCQPIGIVASKRGVSFEQFHFSQELYNHLYTVVEFDSLSFEGLHAPNSVFNSTWAESATNFMGANLEHCRFMHMDDMYATWSGIHVYEGNFARANLTGADMRRSYLRSSDFFSCKLEGADLRGANVNECGLGGSYGKFLSSKPTDRYSMRHKHALMI